MSGDEAKPVIVASVVGLGYGGYPHEETPPIPGGIWITDETHASLNDRLTHRCHILETGNDSNRFKASSEAAKRTTKEAATLTKA